MSDYLMAAIRGLISIGRFRGRDDRATFWPYAALCFAAMMFLPVEPMLAFYRSLSSTDRAAFLARVVVSDDAHIIFNLYEMLGMFAMVRMVFMLAMAAAMVRRIHDVGRSALHVLASLLASVALFATLTVATWDIGQSAELAQAAQSWVMWPSILWLIHFIYVFVQLMRPSDPGFNDWGAEPNGRRESQAHALRTWRAAGSTEAGQPELSDSLSRRHRAILKHEGAADGE